MDKEEVKKKFEGMLEEDEKILISSKSNVSKTDMQLGRIFLMALFLLCTIYGLFYAYKHGGGFDIIIAATVILFVILIIYAFFYNTVLKYKHKDEFYFVTNKRFVKYSEKTGFNFRYIKDIEHIGIVREKNNYADLDFSFVSMKELNKLNDSKNISNLANIIILMKDASKTNMSFSGVEDPEYIVSVITGIKSDIHIYDDKPKMKEGL